MKAVHRRSASDRWRVRSGPTSRCRVS